MRRVFYSDADSDDENIINLTPLIDVVFVVLVAFIIIAPMLEIDLVDLSGGTGEKKSAFQDDSKIQIIVREDNSIFFNNEKTTIIDLEKLLKSYRALFPDHPLQLFHDRKAAFGTYQAIKNAAELSGYDEIQVILKPG